MPDAGCREKYHNQWRENMVAQVCVSVKHVAALFKKYFRHHLKNSRPNRQVDLQSRFPCLLFYEDRLKNIVSR